MKIGRQHKTVRVRCNGLDAPIDTMIAPLIKRLWQCGIYTWNSCQENKPGIIWIQFTNAWCAEQFMNVVAHIPTKKELKIFEFWDTMYGRMTRLGGFGQWEYDCLIENMGEKHGEAKFNVAVSIRFPQTDLPSIMESFGDIKLLTNRLKETYRS